MNIIINNTLIPILIMDLKEIKSMPLLATQKFMLTNKATKLDFDVARRKLYNMGIKSSYDEDRMIYTTMHIHKNKIGNVYAQECNGLILNKSNWRPLVVPPRSLRFNIDTNKSNKFLHQGLYHVYLANDGTCFNMYYWDNKWIISTTSGYDMNNVMWDNKTYQDLISECLIKNNTNWESFINSLDKKCCYSFGFKHPNFHRFLGNTNGYKLWHIQTVNLDLDSPEYLWSCDETPMEQIPNQELYEGKLDNIKDLYKIASDAIDRYLENPTSEPCFGFILRSANFSTTGPHSDLFIESSLMRNIRKIWYDKKLIKLCHSNGWNKETAVVLNSYLDNNLNGTFIQLFPQYSKNFEHYSSIIIKLVNSMIKLCNKNEEEKNIVYSDTANTFLSYFLQNIDYNINTKNKSQKNRVFTEYVTHQSNIEWLIPLFI